MAGEETPKIPNGLVVRGDPGVNEGYSWHIDPDSLEFVDMTTEVCDGLPSDVEQGIITSDYYCPWAAEVIAVEKWVKTPLDETMTTCTAVTAVCHPCNNRAVKGTLLC